jgi:hypothetical protein
VISYFQGAPGSSPSSPSNRKELSVALGYQEEGKNKLKAESLSLLLSDAASANEA